MKKLRYRTMSNEEVHDFLFNNLYYNNLSYNPKNSKLMPVVKKSAKVVKAAPKKSIAPKKAIAKVMKKK